MRERIRKALLISWQLLFPLLIYLAIVELVFLGWQVFRGKVSQEQMLPLTAAAAAAASLPLGFEYRSARIMDGKGSVTAGKGGRKTLFSREGPLGQDLWPALLGVGACLFFNGLLLVPFSEEAYAPVSEQLFRPPLPVQLICMGVLVPAAEELVFRGLGYWRLRRYLPVWPSACLSALLFGLYHGNWIQGLYAGILGVILALVFEACDRLGACICFHGAANMTAVILTGTVLGEKAGAGAGWKAVFLAFGAVLLLTAGRKIKEGMGKT